MWHNLATAIVVAFMVVLPLSNGLYFHIAETERKCFIEEIPDETMVTGKCHILRNWFVAFSRMLSNLNLLQEITKYSCMIQERTVLHHQAPESECT